MLLLQRLGKTIKNSLLHLFFPQLCIHCGSELEPTCNILCPVCSDFLELLEPDGRCPHCFTESEIACDACQQKRPSSDVVAACFDYAGPAKTLVKEFKYADKPYLATSLGGFLICQFVALDWPVPDIITFVPQTFIRTAARGYNQSELLALECARLISRPAMSLLKKTTSTFSQSLLTKEQRIALPQDLFIVKQPQKIDGKTILLIDDVYTTGTTIECSAWAMRQHHPAHIYVLTVCRRDH